MAAGWLEKARGGPSTREETALIRAAAQAYGCRLAKRREPIPKISLRTSRVIDDTIFLAAFDGAELARYRVELRGLRFIDPNAG